MTLNERPPSGCRAWLNRVLAIVGEDIVHPAVDQSAKGLIRRIDDRLLKYLAGRSRGGGGASHPPNSPRPSCSSLSRGSQLP